MVKEMERWWLLQISYDEGVVRVSEHLVKAPEGSFQIRGPHQTHDHTRQLCKQLLKTYIHAVRRH